MAQSGQPELNGLQGLVGMGHCGQNPTTGAHALHHVLPQMSHGPDAHLNSPARVAVVLHGKLQATASLREAMIERGYPFKSQNTTELMAHLIDATYQSDPVQALRRAMELLQGPLAMGVMFKGEPQKMFVVQRDKKLYWGSGPTHIAWASTTDALPKDTIDMIPLCAAQVLEIHSSETIISHCLHT
jgi:glucosamine--fructose-6-phosphate aminotransferase (isomerizing)